MINLFWSIPQHFFHNPIAWPELVFIFKSDFTLYCTYSISIGLRSSFWTLWPVSWRKFSSKSFRTLRRRLFSSKDWSLLVWSSSLNREREKTRNIDTFINWLTHISWLIIVMHLPIVHRYTEVGIQWNITNIQSLMLTKNQKHTELYHALC